MSLAEGSLVYRVGQNRMYTPYMTVYLVMFLPKIPYVHRIYMVLANPTYLVTTALTQTSLALCDVTYVFFCLRQDAGCGFRLPDNLRVPDLSLLGFI